MRSELKKTKNGLIINVSIMDSDKGKLIEEFSKCKQGNCGCPTKEYEKLESLNIEEKPNSISMNLKSKEKQKFDLNEINKCLNYTFEKIEREK